MGHCCRALRQQLPSSPTHSFVCNIAKIYALHWPVSQMAPKFKARAGCSCCRMSGARRGRGGGGGGGAATQWLDKLADSTSRSFMALGSVRSFVVDATCRWLQFYCKLFATQLFFFLSLFSFFLWPCKMQSHRTGIDDTTKCCCSAASLQCQPGEGRPRIARKCQSSIRAVARAVACNLSEGRA